MDAMDYIDTYDPEEEDIFGRDRQVEATRTVITEEQKSDPLRRAKTVLGAYLVAEKLPVTANHIIKRMMDEENRILDHKQFGFTTFEAMLQGIPDTVITRRQKDGEYVYAAKVNLANAAIVDLVAKQSDNREGRRQNSFLDRKMNNKFSSFGAAFRPYKGPKLAELTPSNKPPTTLQKLKSLANTPERAADVAYFLERYGDIMGRPSETSPNKRDITLMELDHSFKNTYGFHVCGKSMTETMMYAALNKPDNMKYIRLIPSKSPDTFFIEPVAETIEKKEIKKSESSCYPSSLGLMYTTIGSESDEIYETGPGFKKMNEQMPSRKPTFDGFGASATIQQPLRQLVSDRFGTITQNQQPLRQSVSERFGTTQSHQPLRNPSPEENVFQFGVGAEFKVTPIPADNKFGSIRRKNQMSSIFAEIRQPPEDDVKRLFNFLMFKQEFKYDLLKPEEQAVVTHHADLFRTSSTVIGETLVSIANPQADIDNKDRGKLRDVLEQDVRWLSECASSLKAGIQQIRLAHVVQPRGVLFVIDNAEDKKDRISDILGTIMNDNMRNFKFDDMRPGMQCVFKYVTDGTANYMRVITIGPAAQSEDKDQVMVALVDHDDPYLVDVRVEDLYPIPNEVSFEKVEPNVMYAAMCGVNGMNVDLLNDFAEHVDLHKDPVPGYVYYGSGTNIPLVDFLVLDGPKDLTWFSHYLISNGAVKDEHSTNNTHLKLYANHVYDKCEGPHLMQVNAGSDDEDDNSTICPEDSDEENRVFRNTEQLTVDSVTPENLELEAEQPDVTRKPEDFLLEMFQKFVFEKRLSGISSSFSFVAELMDNKDQSEKDRWASLASKMKEELEVQGGLPI